MAKIKPDEKMLRELRHAIEADEPPRLDPILRAGVPMDQKNEPGDRHSHFEGRTALEAAKVSYENKAELIDELSRRRREDWEEKVLERWKAEAQIFQSMIDALSRAEPVPANGPHGQRDNQ
jgi:hypothetical protein